MPTARNQQTNAVRGNVPFAHQDHEAATRIAHELRQPAHLWDTAARTAALALFEGRFADAELAIHEGFELGRLAQSVNAQHTFDLQMYALRREQGRLREVLEVVEHVPDIYPAYPVWPYVLADVYAQLGQEDDARAALDDLAADEFRVKELWLFGVSMLAEVCRFLADVERAATLYELLRSYGRRNASGFQRLCCGSVSRSLGILAATMSRWDDAVSDFEVALEMNAEMGARPWLAYTQYDYARMLVARGEAGDRERARELLAGAGALAQELGMSALTERVSGLSNE